MCFLIRLWSSWGKDYLTLIILGPETTTGLDNIYSLIQQILVKHLLHAEHGSRP